jgi:hypothetical protein
MKNTLTLFLYIFLLSAPRLIAQSHDLYLRKADNSFFIDHKVVAKETFFSLGRLYNVSPKTIAVFNKVDMNKGLFIDQKIRIPLTDTNFTQQGNKGTPVFYKAADNDDWASIAKTFRTNTSQLNAWNGNNLSKGQKVIVGLLLSSEMASVTLVAPKENEMVAKDEVKEEKPALKKEKDELKKATEEEKKEEKGTDISGNKDIIPAVDRKEVTATNPDAGYFTASFEQQVKLHPVSHQQTVTAGIFKTNSGWQDGKYYLLIDGVSPGTIIRLINPTNNKSVYAKVLGQMTGIRQNEGLDMRISNAAAARMEISETDKFILKVVY